MTAEEILSRAPVVPVLTIEREEDAVPLARALVAGGLIVLEVTLRTPAALAALKAIAAEVPEALLGAGTVLNQRDYDWAVAAGARFALSPGYVDMLTPVAEAPFIPGIATASELMRGIGAGYATFKFFPAAPLGGPAALSALGGPLPMAKFCPTGGITLKNAPDYLALANVLCVGGSWVAPLDAIRAGDWARIQALANEASALRGG
ncbi:MAG: bifunctional 4-hydroxy-2-oxoglutarate aldolase/2-dehydro-3-deoxy-phosphogluconate aldolase [Alphaproteobacteria bacterium]